MLRFLQIDAEAKELMDGLNELTFTYYKCTNVIVPGSFSTPSDIALYKRNVVCFAADMLDLEKRWMMEETNILETPAVKALLRGLQCNADDLSGLSLGFHSEKLAFLKVASILEMFCGEVCLNKMIYRESDVEDFPKDKFKVQHLGMGVAETWRGTPDCRLRGFSLGDVPVVSGNINLPHEEGSNGTTSVYEAKLKIDKRQHLRQLVKTCVVASFVENNLHPTLNSMVPAICIDVERALVALYCPKQDILLVSDLFKWRNDMTLNTAGIALLWAMINHRYENLIF